MYITASLLDPTLKHSFCISEYREQTPDSPIFVYPISHCKQLALLYINSLLPHSTLSISSALEKTTTACVESEQSFATVPKRRLMDFLTPSRTESLSLRSSNEDSFDGYLAQPLQPNINPIQFWVQSTSPLKSIALEILCVPASSAPVEKVFSRAGRYLSPLRSCLSPSHLETLMLVSYSKS